MDNAKYFFDKAVEKAVGVIAMKLAGKGGIFNRGVSMEQSIRYAYSFTNSTSIVKIGALNEQEENVRLAKVVKPYIEDERDQLVKELVG